MTSPAKKIAQAMRGWAEQQRSLAAYNEKQGKLDVRAAILGAVLTVEGWATELEKLSSEDR